MKKNFLAMTALAAMLFAGCTSSDDLTTRETITKANEAATPINFGTYVGKAGSTRAAAYTGNIDTDILKGAASGFGVFAYYTGANDYPNSVTKPTGTYVESTLKANFMFNQHVSWNATSSLWTYSPMKYWPNEVQTGNVDGQPSTSTGTYGGKVSFFAYAPYMDTYGATGIIEVNKAATYSNANNISGNPKITYKMAADGKNVDLLWGTCADGESYNVVPNTPQGGAKVWDAASDAGEGEAKVNVNLTKQKTHATEASAEKVNFTFKHALAKVGGNGDALSIQLDRDFGDNFGNNGTTPETVVTINSITIAQAGTKALQAVFDLATGHWKELTGTNSFSLAISTSDMNDAIKEVSFNDAAANEYWGTSSGNMLADGHTGVTTVAQNVLSATDMAPLLFFPGETPSLTVTIDYFVRTKDNKLVTGYSEARQVITKTVTFGNPVEMNKIYKLLIKLGLTSVKFEASVSSWDTPANDANTTVNLPLNVTE